MGLHRLIQISALALLVTASVASSVWSQEDVGIVSNVKVLSGNVPDVSSLEAWKRSYISPGMSDKEKAIAVWRSIVQHQHQNSPPKEFVHAEGTVLDFIKIANVYGYSFCSVAAAEVTCLARYAGLKARGWTIRGHCVPEIYYDGKWHLFDPSLINYFPKPDGDIASVAEIIAAINAWYEKNPGFKGNNKKLYAFGRQEGGWGWKRGPRLLADCPFYGIRGWLPARTHGWYSTMQEYDGSKLFRYESGYSQGYRVNVQLREGEHLTRNWSNKGLWANMDGTAGKPGCMTGTIGKGDLVHLPGFGDLAPGRVGNGTLVYDVPTGKPSLAKTALRYDNLSADKFLHVRDAARPGVLVLRVPTSYVYLTGKVGLFTIARPGGKIVASVSLNNGLDWREVATINNGGEHKIDLSKLLLRRYDYQLKLEMTGAGTGIDAFRLYHDVQHSQRPLPALVEGKNTITFSAGAPEGTVTIEASVNVKHKDKAPVYTDFRPQRVNLAKRKLSPTAAVAHLTFPIETPGDMTRLRFGCFYWAGPPSAGWNLQVSFDDGKTFSTVKRFGTSEGRNARYTVYGQVPRNTRRALVRYQGVSRGNTRLMSFRIDADYLEPAGGFRPVKVTYVWTEDGVEKRDVHVAKEPNEVYELTCEKKPLMKSLIVELAD